MDLQNRYPVLNAFAAASGWVATVVGALSLVAAWAAYELTEPDGRGLAVIVALSVAGSGLWTAVVIAALGDVITWMRDVAFYQSEQRALLRRLAGEVDGTVTRH